MGSSPTGADGIGRKSAVGRQIESRKLAPRPALVAGRIVRSNEILLIPAIAARRSRRKRFAWRSAESRWGHFLAQRNSPHQDTNCGSQGSRSCGQYASRRAEPICATDVKQPPSR